jgi:hypothetical protein
MRTKGLGKVLQDLEATPEQQVERARIKEGLMLRRI